MMNRIVRAGGIAAASLLATVALVPAAQADTRTFRDPAPHLTTVKVTHGTTNVTVKADVGPYRLGSYFTFWLDTTASNAGPEYKMEVWPNSDGISVLRVGNFSDAGRRVRCSGFRASADAFSSEYVSIKVPRSCIGNPGKVRVSVKARYDVPGPNITDWGPRKNAFFGWVEQ